MRRCFEVELGDDGFDLLARRLRSFDGLTTFFVQRHLADVDQALDALLELDEGAVVDEADHLAVDARADRDTSCRPGPTDPRCAACSPSDTRSVSRSNLRTTTSTSSPIVEVLGGMIDSAPRDVGDVQQAVDAAEIDEGAVVGDVLDHALHRDALLRASRGSRPSSSRTPSRGRPCATARCCCAGDRG